eukprot:Skav207232  [mRNA]  locus=scaffold523:28411:29004:+ [translate_table: standard]
MVAIAWCLGWRRFGGVLLICFHGIARAGEVLKCVRRNLLLPADILDETGCAFLVLHSSKTMYRQSARVQHLKIVDPYVVKLLENIYQVADEKELLYPGSAESFRRRWEHILRLLRVPEDVRLTPGGLRGGGAVNFYRAGGGIADLLWRMRLKQIATLESYLQEVGAISILTDLTAEARFSISSASRMFRVLAQPMGS